MGMFDTVNFTCPDCGGLVEVQSKAGECILAGISPDEVPIKIAEDIVGYSAWCPACDQTFSIAIVDAPQVVKMRLE